MHLSLKAMINISALQSRARTDAHCVVSCQNILPPLPSCASAIQQNALLLVQSGLPTHTSACASLRQPCSDDDVGLELDPKSLDISMETLGGSPELKPDSRI